MEQPTIYTLGYTGLHPQDLLPFINETGVKLVDVRLSPRSRNEAWRLLALMEVFGERYAHIPEFGNVNYKNSGPIKLKAPYVGMAQALPWLKRNHPGVILLCACRDHATCHRTTVAEFIAKHNQVGSIIHLTFKDLKPGGPEQLSLF